MALSPLKDSLDLGPGTGRAYNRDYQRLLAFLGGTRPIEARVTGERSYRRYRPPFAIASLVPTSRVPSTTRGASPPKKASSESRIPVKFVQAIQKAARREPSPENRAALAVLHVINSRAAEAIPLLREAHAQKPEDPRLLNDLAAALLAVSQGARDPWPALEAVEAARRSLRLEPSLPALFNLALALERWGLRTRAIAAWERYLEEDDRSDWAGEAARRLGRLKLETSEDRPVAGSALDFPALPENPWATRQRGERLLLTRWAEQTLDGPKAEAEAALDEAETLALALPAGGGRLLAASAEAIREAEKSGDAERLDRLARGHHAVGKAFSLARREEREAALALLDDAIRDLRAAGSPFELRARVLRALNAAETDWAELQQLDRAAEEGGFPSIRADARFVAAHRISLEGRLETAVDAYRDARERFEELEEREMSAVIAVMLAELLDVLGREQESGTELAAALAAGPDVVDPWHRYSIYVVAASTAAGRFSRAAVELRQEAADACRDLREKSLCEVDSWLWVAALTPDADIAKDALQRAEELLLKVPDSDGKTRTRIDLKAARAGRLAQDDRSRDEWEEAAELYREAAASYEAIGRAPSVARARVSRARTLLKLGQPEDAAAEYRSALAAFRRWDQRDRFRPENAERHSPRELREVFERLIEIELEMAQGRTSPTAFLLSEEMRDRLAPRRSVGLWMPGRADIDRFAAAVPPGTAVVEYAVLGGRAVAWILAGGRLDQVTLTPGDQLAKRIRFLTERRSSEAWKEASKTLFQDLLAPVLERLPAGTERLVLIPDSDLYGVPFRALWSSASGRYMDEMFAISLAPSVRQLLGSGEERDASPARPRSSVLSLGFSRFDPTLHLEELPWADQEAAAVRERYHGVPPCPATDWAGFRRCAPQAGVLHLATHAAADSTASGGTWLAFERETVSLDRLWRELPDLPQRPLVVLSACQSVAAAGGGEGLGGLARPFLASGARAVVGTLWKVRDEDAARLFPAFHRAYRESGDAAEALRRSRESMEEKPWVWGAIQTVSAGF